MRVFLAVFPPRAALALAFRTAESLRFLAQEPGVSWVKSENLHYTLRFIGEIGEDGARRVAEAAREAARGMAPFQALLGEAGGFPSPRGARVLWIGLAEGADPMRELAKRLESALAKRGWERERQPFKPHLTIARVRQPGFDWSEPIRVTGSLAGEPKARFEVSAIACVDSTLSPQGSIYRVYETARLEA